MGARGSHSTGKRKSGVVRRVEANRARGRKGNGVVDQKIKTTKKIRKT
jgi:hypothetical protein